MEKDIVRKIRGTFARGVDSEEAVVYMLVELRKLMELNGDLPRFPTPRLYCNWVAHPNLDNPDAQRIVCYLDRYEELLHMGAFAPGKRLEDADRELVAELRGTLELTNFQRELVGYLGSHVLDDVPFETWDSWISFLALYASVIQDCPLRCIRRDLSYVEEVAARVVDDANEGELRIDWSRVSKQTGEIRTYSLLLSSNWGSIRTWPDF